MGSLDQQLRGHGNGNGHEDTTYRFSKARDSLEMAKGPGKNNKHEVRLDKTKTFSSLYTLSEPWSLSWRNVNYSVLVKKQNKVILKDCAGDLAPGKMLAILGPSGSGKTSLLNVVAGRVTAGELEGEILLNGKPRTDSFRLLSAYVVQDDALFSSLTVRETMLIAAELRLPSGVELGKKQEVAEKVINELGLAKSANTRIGNAFVRGISGGEKKRVNIGVEMMGNPSLVFLDEPTSGLDSFQAQNVVQALKDLSQNGRTVVMTIHQPRSSIFQMFDTIMLLSEGNLIYFGGAHAEAASHFGSLGYKMPEEFNPADFYLDLISLDTRSPEAEAKTRDRIEVLARNCKTNQEPIPSLGMASASEPEVSKGAASDYRAGKLHQFRVLFGRALTQITRDKIPLMISVFTAVFFALIVGMLYMHMDKNQRGIQDRMGALFFVVVNNAFGQMFAILNVFSKEKLIVQREFAARAYNTWPYYVSKLVAEQPFRLIGPLVFCCIAYPIIGLNGAWDRFLVFVLIVLLLAIAAQTLGIFLGSISKNEEIAANVSPLATVILLLFGGFYVNKDTIPPALNWIEYLSHIQWAFTALCVNEFKGQEGWKCDGFESESNLCDVTGEQILHRLSMDGQTVWEPIISQILLICLLHCGAYWSLCKLQPKFKPLETKKGVSPVKAVKGSDRV